MTAARRLAAPLAVDFMGLLARERGGEGTAIRELCEAQDSSDTPALRGLVKTHR
jgi:hypothetical protein